MATVLLVKLFLYWHLDAIDQSCMLEKEKEKNKEAAECHYKSLMITLCKGVRNSTCMNSCRAIHKYTYAETNCW